jgi:CubicO group peptidase (beta-lactamase class C family)
MSVISVCNSHITNEYHYGLSDIKRNIQVSNETRYRIASISKHVTAIGLMRLWE